MAPVAMPSNGTISAPHHHWCHWHDCRQRIIIITIFIVVAIVTIDDNGAIGAVVTI
jgi:hypothetical protein